MEPRKEMIINEELVAVHSVTVTYYDLEKFYYFIACQCRKRMLY